MLVIFAMLTSDLRALIRIHSHCLEFPALGSSERDH